jgi:hypothetical protein
MPNGERMNEMITDAVSFGKALRAGNVPEL